VESAEPSPRSSWICRTEEERARVVAMHNLLVPANRKIALAGIVSFLICVPRLPPSVIVILAASFGVLAVISQNLSRWRRPEIVMVYATAGIETADAVAMALAHVQLSGAMTLLLWPLMSFNARYPRRVAIAGTAFTVLLLIAVDLVSAPGGVLADPLTLTIPLAVVIAVATVSSATRESDIEHMRRAVLDPLTGLLNRSALGARVNELAQRSTYAGLGVAVLLGDIDSFKAINDRHGHQRGDEVLHGVADRLREELRAFDLLYRIGGEEFVVLAPGATLAEGIELAERLRLAVERAPVSGLAVTISWGASASQPGERFDWEELYRAADTAMYEAKRAGRNRVTPARSLPALAA